MLNMIGVLIQVEVCVTLWPISKVSVQVRVVLPVLVHVVTHSYLAHLPYL